MRRNSTARYGGQAAFGRLLFVVGVGCVLLAVVLVCQRVVGYATRLARSQEVVERLEAVMPPAHTMGTAGPAAAEDLPMLWLDGVSYVGVLDVEGADARLPVCAAEQEAGADLGPYVWSGTPKDCLVLADAGSDGPLAGLWGLAEGQRVTFADVDGATLTYEVKAHVTQDALDLDDRSLDGSRLILCSYNSLTRRYRLVCCVLAS